MLRISWHVDAPKYSFTHRNLPESENYIWIIQNVPEQSRVFYISIRHSDVFAFTETVEFLERSLASMLMRYCCSMIGCYFFSKNNRLAETHSYFQLSYQITDRLLAAGNYLCQLLRSPTFCMSIKSLQIKFYIIA